MKISKSAKELIWAVGVALFLEILLFNFSTIKSLGNNPVAFSDCMQKIDTVEGCEIVVDNPDMNINNLWINANIPKDIPVTYHVTLTDDGNFYEYYLPEAVLTKGSKACKYVNIYPYGKVHYVRLTMNCPSEWIEGISANVKRPMMFNFIRFLAVFAVIAFVMHAKRIDARVIITITCMILWIVIGLGMTSSHKLFKEDQRPHHQQYKELARALSQGKVSLDYEPSEGLLNAKNPYDTIYLQANQIEYLGDYAYYDGKYYVYFGIVPEVMLYLPYYLLTGRDLPNHVATFIFYAMYVMGIFGFFSLLWKRYFKDIDFGAYLLTSSFAVSIGNIVYVVFTADIYSVPIMGGLAFTALGLFFWMLGVTGTCSTCGKKMNAMASFAIGSLCMALVAGCRPQMLMYSLLIIPLVINEIFRDKLFKSKILLLMLPYILVAIPVMYYNYARFGSVFDFGATYSLTNNDMNLRGFSISRLLLSLGDFMFKLPNISSAYPFLKSSEMNYSYMGRIVTEYFFGGVLVSNVLMYSLLWVGKYKNSIKARKLVPFMVVSVAASLIISVADANTAGVLQRYTADFVFGLILCVSVMLFLLWGSDPLSDAGNRLSDVPGKDSLGDAESHISTISWNELSCRRVLKIGLLFEIAYSFLIVINNVSGISLSQFNPELFNLIGDLFRF